MFELMSKLLNIWHGTVSGTFAFHFDVQISGTASIRQFSCSRAALADYVENFFGILKLLIGRLTSLPLGYVLRIFAIEEHLNTLLVIALQIGLASCFVLFATRLRVLRPHNHTSRV